MPMSPGELLQPISQDRPAGEDLRWTPEWDRVREARRADDRLSSGKWEKKDHKSSEWPLVEQLTSEMLRSQSKDLQIAMWFTEANVRLHGFPGLRDGLSLLLGLIKNFWDDGLFPLMEDGPQDRSGPFEWLNEKLADTVVEVPLTRATQGDDFNLLNLRDARLVGSESSWRDKDGEVDDARKKSYDEAMAAGRRSMEMFQRALRDSPREDYERLQQEFEQSFVAFKELEAVIDEKFGNLAPSLKEFRATMNELHQEIADCLEKKQRQEPMKTPLAGPASQTNAAGESGSGSNGMTIRLPLTAWNGQQVQNSATSSWQEAERLVRTGEVDLGLAEMMRLAASETSGRSRFQRKLLLAEVCLSSNRERLARTILEELAELIERFQLETWETSEMVCGVWTRLYELYKRGSTPDPERADKLYDRLCRLDPWQALACSE